VFTSFAAAKNQIGVLYIINVYVCPLIICNRSRGYNARFTATHLTVTVCRVLQMRGGGYADVLPCTSSAWQQNRCGALWRLTI